MKYLSNEDKKNLCLDYKNGLTIKELYTKYSIGDRRVRTILNDNGIEIHNSHKITTSTDDYIEKNKNRFNHHDGYKYVAVLISDENVVFDDYLNKSGTLIGYIKNKLNIEIPTLFKRKKYFHENGKQWYEQYFKIIEVADQKFETKKCPYCNWETIDIHNKSGVFETHLLKEHSITKLQYLEEHPEDKDYFVLVNKTLNRKMETDTNKFVCCAICGEKYARLDWRHLAKHGISKKEYIDKYANKTVSNELHDNLSKITIEVNKNMKPTFISKPEKDISEYIKSFGVECVNSDRKILNGKELDIYIPSKKVAIEYNGNFWHTDKFVDNKKHYNKTIECKNIGVKLLQIFEDEYFNKREIVYNKIKHIIGIYDNSKKIMGRKCVIKEVDKHTANNFLNKYHIQGFVSSTYYYGAYYNNELVAVMSFKKEQKEGCWELTRFASNYNYICQGIGGKLFKYFIRNYNPIEVKSFADRRWTIDEENNIYIQLGFKFDKYTRPDYRYYNPSIDRYNRFHKFNFRKQVLHKKYGLPLSMTETEMTERLGYKKIYDCGLIKYVWKH